MNPDVLDVSHMHREEMKDVNGRKYIVMIDRTQGEEMPWIIVGPPEGLVDELGIGEPFATQLHNILFRRGLLTYDDVVKNQKSLPGVIQELLLLDAQRLNEAYFKYFDEKK